MVYGGSVGHMTDDVTWPRKVKGRDLNMFGAHYLENGWRLQMSTCRKLHLGESNGHVTDCITWPWKVKVVNHIYLDALIPWKQLKIGAQFQWDTN